jgi:hypothetical protein
VLKKKTGIILICNECSLKNETFFVRKLATHLVVSYFRLNRQNILNNYLEGVGINNWQTHTHISHPQARPYPHPIIKIFLQSISDSYALYLLNRYYISIICEISLNESNFSHKPSMKIFLSKTEAYEKNFSSVKFNVFFSEGKSRSFNGLYSLRTLHRVCHVSLSIIIFKKIFVFHSYLD